MSVDQVPEIQVSQAFPKIDLFYILPNLLVGSFPSTKKFLSTEKSTLESIVDVLDTKFKQIVILNLAGERETYSVKNPKISVNNISWLDYHPLPFAEFINLVYLTSSVLQNSQNAVFVHCKHGKGRTGTLISGILIMLFELKPEEAFNIFIKRRKLYNVELAVLSQAMMLDSFEYVLHYNLQNYRDIHNTTKFWKITHFKLTSNKVSERRVIKVSIGNLKNLTNGKDNILFHKKFDSIINSNNQLIDTKIEEDFCLLFEYTKYIRKMYTTCTINCAVEFLKKRDNKKDISNANDELTMTLKLPITKMDGIKGTSFRGKPYFHYLELTIVKCLKED